MVSDVGGPFASCIFTPQIESANAHNVRFRMNTTSVGLDQ